jgi:predicted nucleic acid-binding protein
MTLIDASLLIDYLRTKDLQLLARIKTVEGALCGVTRTEVLSGARSDADHLRLTKILDGFQQVLIPQTLWDEVGKKQSQLRAGGLTIPLADAVLITVGLTLDIEVWARDAHYRSAQLIFPALKIHKE